jgi:hypothetical protein
MAEPSVARASQARGALIGQHPDPVTGAAQVRDTVTRDQRSTRWVVAEIAGPLRGG